MPSGTEMAVAQKVMMIVPATAGPIPGPSWRVESGMALVMKDHRKRWAPWRMTS